MVQSAVQRRASSKAFRRCSTWNDRLRTFQSVSGSSAGEAAASTTLQSCGVIIDIDLNGTAPAVELIEPHDCKRFHVAARGGDSIVLEATLRAHQLGHLRPSGDALIATAAVRRMAEGRVPVGWDDDFAAMLQYAETKGWLDDSGAMIEAHVEWGDEKSG